MKINIARFYGQERLELDCEIVTPMFLGGADQEAALRAAPFKGQLRYWWRIARGHNYATYQDMLTAESRIFGSADESSGGKSQVTVSVAPITAMQPSKNGFGDVAKVAHPECEKTHGRTNPLNYLAGMGLIHYRQGIQHAYFPVGEKFRLTITATRDAARDVTCALALFARFGAIGSRSRNGWGCFAASREPSFSPELVDWKNAMDRDYPHCLGRDQNGALLWKTGRAHADWRLCMRDLAENYIMVRTSLDVVTGSPPDRHLLGYPVTRHPVKKLHWGNQGRHASALRLLVREEGNNRCRGYFLHLPHAYSSSMWPNDTARQVHIWETVHRRLDELCTRVPTGEVQ